MTEEAMKPQVKFDYVGFLTCDKCGYSRLCVDLISVAVDKTNYDTPCYSLALCQRCLGGLSRQIEKVGSVQTTPKVLEREVDEEVSG